MVYPRSFPHADTKDDWFLLMSRLEGHSNSTRAFYSFGEMVRRTLVPVPAHALRGGRHDLSTTEFRKTRNDSLMAPMGIARSSDESQDENANSDSSDDSEDHGEFQNVNSKGIDCEYNDWQTFHPVACNTFHEIHMDSSVSILGCGGNRCAIQIQDVFIREECSCTQG